jgi:CubicO group peptidase (beta-lactamase class C family)
LSAVKNQPGLGQIAANSSISQALERLILAPRVAPAASAGWAVAWPDGAPPPSGSVIIGEVGAAGRATEQTLFDLASVSKPVVAATLARLAARGTLPLDTPLGDVLTEARGTASERVPLELLLAHRAGLDAHRALFAPVLSGRPFRRGACLREAAAARRPDCTGAPPPEGFAPVYSDLGYLLLGAAIEAAVGCELDRVIDDEVSQPLGLELGSARLLRARRPDFASAVAPTEIVPARGGVLCGVVHDENAWALAGHGAAGHAGLFGSVAAVLGFGQALLLARAGRSSWLSSQALEPLVRVRPGGTLRAGFDGKSQEGSSAGALCGPETFGHLGFTGTSLWCDPAAEIACTLLCNRVHPTRDNPRIRAARPLVHDALFAAANRHVGH